jgi:phosphatidylinositol-3-phosphatase
MRMTNAPTPDSRRERCSRCSAMLADDQRYCLQCGERQGNPRLDFTAFWKPLSLTAGHEPARNGDKFSGTSGASASSPTMPSRRLAGALATGVLAAGILVGAALGPTPPNSPADSSTLAQRVIAVLATHTTDRATQTGTAVSGATPAENPEPAATPGSPRAKRSRTAPKKETTSIPSQSSPSDSPAGVSPSEGSSPKGSSHSNSSSKGTEPDTPIKLPAIKHVWLISVSGVSLDGALAQPRGAPYLARQLAPRGTLLSGYELTASSALANGVALLSGQGVNLDTEQNCPTYLDVQPPSVNATNGLAEGIGCVYPPAVKTLPDELTAAGLTWKAYVQGMQTSSATAPASGTNPATDATAPAAPTSCRHPSLGAADLGQAPTSSDPYITFRNPFVYFHSLLDGGACTSSDVDLGQLDADLATPASTPSFSWIAPSRCDDGSSAPCSPEAPAGLTPLDSFLEQVVPKILATAAYRRDGLIEIVPDSGTAPSVNSTARPVGALLISPFVHAGAHVSEPLSDFSLSKSIARLFGVLPLGHSGDASTVSLGANVYRTTK